MRLQTDYIDIFQLHWPDRYAIPLHVAASQLLKTLYTCDCLPSASDLYLCLAVNASIGHSKACDENMCFSSRMSAPNLSGCGHV